MSILGAVASIGGALIGSSATKKASQAQTASADRALALQQQQYDQQRADMAPYLQQGYQSLAQLNAENQKPFSFSYNDMTADPGYEFRQQQANKALERSAAARGGLFSGATGRSLSALNQDMASQEFNSAYGRAYGAHNDRLNRLSSLAGVGQTTATNLGNAGQNYASNAGNIMGQQANAQAANYGAQAGLWSGAMNNIAGMANLYKMGAYN
jgi:hypothetical protein